MYDAENSNLLQQTWTLYGCYIGRKN